MDTNAALEYFFRNARKRHSMFGLDDSYGEYVAYLTGFDAGTDNRTLGGFTEWVAYRTHNDGANIAWPALVLREAGFPLRAGWHTRARDDNDRAVASYSQNSSTAVDRQRQPILIDFGPRTEEGTSRFLIRRSNPPFTRRFGCVG
jgi:hypothetical protein